MSCNKCEAGCACCEARKKAKELEVGGLDWPKPGDMVFFRFPGIPQQRGKVLEVGQFSLKLEVFDNGEYVHVRVLRKRLIDPYKGMGLSDKD